MWSSRSHEDTRSSIYFAPAGQWVPRGAVLRCLIDDSAGAEPVIHVDDHELSLREFGWLLRTYAGWGMRIVFVEDDDADPPLVEIRDPENGEAAHDWRWPWTIRARSLRRGALRSYQDWFHCLRPVSV